MRKVLLRRQNRALDDEDAAELKLGPGALEHSPSCPTCIWSVEFQNEHCLLHAEVKILMDKLKQADGQLIDATNTTMTTGDRHQLGPYNHHMLIYPVIIVYWIQSVP